MAHLALRIALLQDKDHFLVLRVINSLAFAIREVGRYETKEVGKWKKRKTSSCLRELKPSLANGYWTPTWYRADHINQNLHSELHYPHFQAPTPGHLYSDLQRSQAVTAANETSKKETWKTECPQKTLWIKIGLQVSYTKEAKLLNTS